MRTVVPIYNFAIFAEVWPRTWLTSLIIKGDSVLKNLLTQQCRTILELTYIDWTR